MFDWALNMTLVGNGKKSQLLKKKKKKKIVEFTL